MYMYCNVTRACLWIYIISSYPLLTEFNGPTVSYGLHFFHFNLLHKGHKLKWKKRNFTTRSKKTKLVRCLLQYYYYSISWKLN